MSVRNSRNAILIVIAISVVAMMVVSCGTNRNTAMSRFGQALNTRYNVYYHGKTNYDEQIQVMENDYEDDYTGILLMHPAEAKNVPKAPQPSGNFDRTIEKMQKAIVLHSIKKRPRKNYNKTKDPKYREWLKRDEYNPFLHNAWRMLGKAEYMKGEFASSAATFHYITRHFTWMPELVQESYLWEALCYCALGWLNEAENILERQHPEKMLTKSNLKLYNFVMADYWVKRRDYKSALPYLESAAKESRGAQGRRLTFLLGQVYMHLDRSQEAYKAFHRVSKSLNASHRTKLNARIKQSEVYTGSNIESEVKALRRLARYGANKTYLDQIYYAIGNLYLMRQDTVNAIENYKTGASKSTRNGIDKAVLNLRLGGIYFAQHNYADAQPCYSSAITQISEDYPNYALLKRRSDVLDELAVYSQNVKLQDSLLVLSKLSEAEQMKVCQRLADELIAKEKKEKEDAEREKAISEQNAKNAANTANTGSAAAPTEFNLNTDNSWYFYNATTKAAGKTAFLKLWGSRKLEDDWRRRDKLTFSMSDFGGDDGKGEDAESGEGGSAQADSLQNKKGADASKENDPHFPEYYFKQIPKTDAEVQNCHNIIQEGLYNEGVILKDKLEDFAAAVDLFNKLNTDYPDNIYRLDAYNNTYLIYARLNDRNNAEKYRQLIVEQFPESKTALAMADPNYLDNLRSMYVNQEKMYAEAYRAYLNNDNLSVHRAYDEIQKRYPLSQIMPKFMFINALSYLTEKNYTRFKEELRNILERYPNTDITPVATDILKKVAQGRKLEGGGSNVRSMVWNVKLSTDSATLASDPSQAAQFVDDKSLPHYCVLLFDTDSISSNQLLFNVARHNFNTFVVRDFDIEPMTFANLGILTIKGFDNYGEVVHYRKMLEQDKQLQLPSSVRVVLISESNFKLLLNEGRTFDEYFKYLDAHSDKMVEKKALAGGADFDNPTIRNLSNGDDDTTSKGKSNDEDEYYDATQENFGITPFPAGKSPESTSQGGEKSNAQSKGESDEEEDYYDNRGQNSGSNTKESYDKRYDKDYRPDPDTDEGYY